MPVGKLLFIPHSWFVFCLLCYKPLVPLLGFCLFFLFLHLTSPSNENICSTLIFFMLKKRGAAHMHPANGGSICTQLGARDNEENTCW